MESRTQRSKPRPMIQKNPRQGQGLTSRGLGQECSRPRTQAAGVLQNEKKVFARENANFQGKVKKAHGHGSFSTIQYPRPRAGHFRGLAAFKAKDLTFEAKAKDFKMCHRGLRLCYLGFLAAIFNAKICSANVAFSQIT